MSTPLKNKERLKFVLHAPQHLGSDADIEYICPKCGTPVWEVHVKDGVGKLPKQQVKMKCVGCGMWFITNRDYVEKILGGI